MLLAEFGPLNYIGWLMNLGLCGHPCSLVPWHGQSASPTVIFGPGDRVTASADGNTILLSRYSGPISAYYSV